jgi:hypothetical protein
MRKTRKSSESVDLSMYHSMKKVNAENNVLLPVQECTFKVALPRRKGFAA